VTDAKWRTCQDLYTMLTHVHANGAMRKLRLFAVACCRRFAGLGRSRRAVDAVETAERHADGLANDEELAGASDAAHRASRWTKGDARSANYIAYGASAPFAAPGELHGFVNSAIIDRSAWDAERAAQVALLREIVGDSLRPQAIKPAWRSPDALALAQAAYDSCEFASLPILADALEEAGCAGAALLAHLRGPGPHVRGCWALDLILGKE
jgi:hypothetical protein